VTPKNYDIEITNGQSVYVPVYSHVYFFVDKRRFLIATTLSIRNTDPDHSITVRDVDYFDSGGAMLQSYVEQPVVLGPLATTDFFVAKDDTRGGAGANFIVNWDADAEVYAPVVEAVMVGTGGARRLPSRVRGRATRSDRWPLSMRRRSAREPEFKPSRRPRCTTTCGSANALATMITLLECAKRDNTCV
jgi:hypothetical protein